MIPMIHQLLVEGCAGGGDRPICPYGVVVAPTRELAIQIYEGGPYVRGQERAEGGHHVRRSRRALPARSNGAFRDEVLIYPFTEWAGSIKCCLDRWRAAIFWCARSAV